MRASPRFGGPRGPRSGFDRARAWLAILALVVQALLPGHVIAGLHAPPPRADTWALEHSHSDDAGPEHEPDSADHQAPHCPFCLIHKIGALPPPDPGVEPRLADEDAAVLPIGTDIVPIPHFLTCVHCRAPPHASKPG